LVLYYQTGDGHCAVENFIDSLPARNQAKVFNWISALEEHGPHLPRPFADLVEDGIHELRIKLSGNHYRILYFFCYGEFIILSHVFRKLVDKVPPVEVHKAQRNRSDYLQRHTLTSLQEQAHENI
jgi:phage-related protein